MLKERFPIGFAGRTEITLCKSTDMRQSQRWVANRCSIGDASGRENRSPRDSTENKGRTLEGRMRCEIDFLRIQGYGDDLLESELTDKFHIDSDQSLSTRAVRTMMENG